MTAWRDRSAAWRWSFGIMLFLSMAVGAFLNSALSVLAPFLRDDVGLSRAQLGSLATLVSLTAALCSPVVGRVADSWGGRRLLVAGGLGVLGSLALLGVAPSYPFMLAAVALTGIALAVGNPATNKLIAQNVPPGSQGLLMGVKQSGGQLNWVLAGSLLPSVAVAFGWRWSLVIGMSLALLNIGAVLTLLPAEPRQPPSRRGDPDSAQLGSLIVWLSAYAFLMSSGTVAVHLYLPLFAHEQVGISERQAGLVAAGMAVVSIVTRIVWSHRLERVSSPGRALGTMAAMSVVGTVLIWTAQGAGAGVLVVGAVVFGTSATAWGTLVMLFVMLEGGARHAGRASGAVLLWGFGGNVITPVLFGYLVDRSDGSYHAAWACVLVLFSLATVVGAAWHVRRAASVRTVSADHPPADHPEPARPPAPAP